MSDRFITYEEAVADIFAPWFEGKDLTAGDRVAEPRAAAAKAVLAYLNTSGEKGTIRVLVQTADAKRSVRNYLDAFLLDEPRLKKMVRKMAPEVIHLHGGINIVVDANEARLARDAIATIVLDATVSAAIAHLWLADGQTEEEACIKAGIDPALAHRVMFARWLTAEEAGISPPEHPWDVAEPGPPKETPPRPDPDAELDRRLQAQAKQREAQERYEKAIEDERRRVVAERLADGYRKLSRSIA